MTREELIDFAKHLDEGCNLLGESYIESRTDEYLNKVANKNLALTDVMLPLSSIRNKLSPLKNLIAMIENGLAKGNVEMHDLLLKEIEQCKKNIAYLAGN
jgi:hypothetical protein